MSELQPPKGTFDIVPCDGDPSEEWKNTFRWQYVEHVIRTTARDYGYHEIRTPIFEKAELFQKNTGASSDIVTKEMYTFTDKGDRLMTLRPEGTPPVLRAFIDKQLQQKSPVHKFYYLAPMFRYDRPQAGRYRQHHQFGVEVIGNKTAEQDVEVIDFLLNVYQRLHLKDLRVSINTLGTSDVRAKYRSALKEYLHPYLSQLSQESQVRYEVNPLRVLDSKDAQDQEIVKNAPVLLEFLDEYSHKHFNEVCHFLTHLGIAYEVSPRLVRGLDYYNHTVFEVMTHDVGAQNSLGGGGRYDGLLKAMGGADLPSVGFGAGLERLIRTMIEQKVFFPKPFHPMLLLVPMGQEELKCALVLAKKLRQHNIAVEVELGQRKPKAALRYGETIGATYVIVIGEDELKSSTVELKTMATHTSYKLALQDVPGHLSKLKTADYYHAHTNPKEIKELA